MSVKKAMAKVLRTPSYRYQRDGVRFIEKTKGHALLADDMGLGKSLQSLAWAAIHPELRPLIVVCPSSLKYNWARELKTHAGLKSYICDGFITTKEQDQTDLRKKLDEIKKRKWKRGYLKRRAILAAKRHFRKRERRNLKKRREARKAKILIVNFDILEHWLDVLEGLDPKILIIDECHYAKNLKARRTKACRSLSRVSEHVIALSGTPISGRPAEFFPVLNMINPAEFPSFWKFAFEYCNPTRNRWSGGWDFHGASNLDMLHRRLKGLMIRRMKKDVLKDLPSKTRTVIPVDLANRKVYDKAEANFLEWLRKHKGDEAWRRASRAEAIVKLNGLKVLSAKGKLKIAIQWIRDWLEETDQKLLVFAIHKPILGALKKAFPKAMVIDGSVSASPVTRRRKDGTTYETSKRQEMVDQFQTDPNSRLFFGQLKAAGTGLNLTAASNVLFLEIGWTPGEHDQAEDRSLRIGQKNHVQVYYLVGRNTVEERILQIIQEKDSTVARILDGKKSGTMRILDAFMSGGMSLGTWKRKAKRKST